MSPQHTKEAPEALIASLYDAALEPARWPLALTLIARSVRGHGVHVALWNDTTQSTPFYADVGIDPAAPKAFDEHWGALDPALPLLMTRPAGMWSGCHQLWDEAFAKASPFYQDFLRPYGIRHRLLSRQGNWAELSALLAVVRPPGAPAFSAVEEHFLDRMSGHLQNAFRVQLRLAVATARAEVLEGAAHLLADAMFIASGSGAVHFANAAAESLLQQAGCPLAVRGGRMSAGSAEDKAQLLQLIAAAANTGSGGALRLKRAWANGTAATCFDVIVCPLSPRLRLMHAAREPLALLLVLDEAHTPIASPQLFRTLFGFTVAETRLALALAGGMTPVEYAADASVSIETVRTQLSSLLSKTGSRRQPNLISLLKSIPAPRQ